MAPLKSLEAQYSILDSNFQLFCASHGIFTVEDFLIHDVSVLTALAEQKPFSGRLKEGITQMLSIIDEQHQPWSNGLQLLEDALQNKHVLSTGFEGIDALLGGGVREGQLTELVGPSSSGKTQVCLQVAANVAIQHTGSVIFMDTGNSFSPQRIEHFVHRISGSAFNENFVQKVMSNILCHSVFDIFSMFDVLRQVEIGLKSQQCKGDCKVRSIIVDSISSLITPVLGGSGSQGHALMTSAGFLLKKLAHEHNIAVLVTNHMVTGEGGNPKPALGESWKSIPHVRLLLSCDHRNNACKISILKHTSLGFRKRTDEIYRNYDGLLEKLITDREQRRKTNKCKGEAKDFLDIMLDVMEDDNAEIRLTKNHIKALILDFFTAATDTTAITIEWAMAELINNPKVAEKAREEIDRVVGNNRIVQESDNPKLEYIQAILKETFRLHPPIPMLSRKSIQDCKINGYTIPANSLLFVNIWSIGRDPKYWKNPLEFKPERFLQSNSNSNQEFCQTRPVDVRGQHFQLLPFGTGRRSCPGISLAMQELPTTLAAMIQCFDWEVVNPPEAKINGGDHVLDMTERPGLTAPRLHDLVCIPVPRLPHILDALSAT